MRRPSCLRCRARLAPSASWRPPRCRTTHSTAAIRRYYAVGTASCNTAVACLRHVYTTSDSALPYPSICMGRRPDQVAQQHIESQRRSHVVLRTAAALADCSSSSRVVPWTLNPVQP